MDYVFKCLHCNDDFIINRNDFNCMILRHGSYINNMQPIHPHLNKFECDKLVDNSVIYGCGKPLRIININDTFTVEICDYI